MQLAEKPVVKRIPKLTEDRFALAEHARQFWVATVEKEVTLDQLLEPSFWAHIARRVTPGARIEVHTDAMTWMAELYVRSTGESGISVSPLSFHEFTSKDMETETKDYTIKHRGAYAKWSIMRKSDGAVIEDKIQTAQEAAQRMLELMGL
jgi:hypothetical protein